MNTITAAYTENLTDPNVSSPSIGQPIKASEPLRLLPMSCCQVILTAWV